MSGTLHALCQAFPPKPNFTEKDLADLSGKVGDGHLDGAPIAGIALNGC